MKMIPVLQDILDLRDCTDCGQLHINEHKCYECGEYLCNECNPRDHDDFMVICEECDDERNLHEQEQEDLNDFYQFVYGDF